MHLCKSDVEDFGVDLVEELRRQLVHPLDEIVVHVCCWKWIETPELWVGKSFSQWL